MGISLSGTASADVRAGVRLQTGELFLWSTGPGSLNLTGYTITAPGGNLIPGNWLSIANNYDASSGGEVDTNDNWFIFSQTSTDLSEGELLGNGGQLPSLVPVSLGNVWNMASTQSLTLTASQGNNPPVVSGIAYMYDADFDGDGDVDGTDLDVWRGGFGMTGASFLNGDANRDGLVDAADYTIWRDMRGLAPIAGGLNVSSGAGSGGPTLGVVAVPEPATWMAGIIATILGWLGRRKLVPVPVPVRRQR